MPTFVWVILAVIVALILFFWLLPQIFGGDSNNASAAFTLVGALLAK